MALRDNGKFVFSCLLCLKRIEDGNGSVLSCKHFVCNSCAMQPDKCPICHAIVRSEPLNGTSEVVADFLIDGAEHFKRALEVSELQASARARRPACDT